MSNLGIPVLLDTFDTKVLHNITRNMKYYLLAGEASGDLHGANLMKGLKQADPDADFRFWGGDKMTEQGGTRVKHIRETAFMGLLEVLMNLRTIKKNFGLCEQDLLSYSPDVLFLIDYPGFNLRMAKFAKERGINVYYYISPKIWAWKESRIHKIKAYVDRMFVIFPFEVEFYKKHNFEVDYVGNPLMDAIEQQEGKTPSFSDFVAANQLDGRPIVALLAGSRKQEINKLLPLMIGTAEHYPKFQFVVAGAPSIDQAFYKRFLAKSKVQIVYNQTYDLLKHSRAALVTSGTATLETALLGIPQVVCYKTAWLTYTVGKLFVKIRFFSLVNLVMDMEVVKELLQHDLEQDIREELDQLLPETATRAQMLANYQTLQRKVGGSGASLRAAKLAYGYLKNGD